MGGEISTGSFLLPLATAAMVVVGETVIMVVVPWGGPTAFQVGSLEVCQRGRTESTKVVGEMELI